MDSVRAKERNLIGHGERVQREEEGLRESLQNAFAGNREVYFKEELSALASAYEEAIQSNMSVSLGLSATKWVWGGLRTQERAASGAEDGVSGGRKRGDDQGVCDGVFVVDYDRGVV